MWFWYALLSASLSACSVVYTKHVLKRVSASLMTWSLFALTLPIVALFAIQKPISITPIFVGGVLGSSFSFAIAKTLKNKAFSQGELSKVFPLTSFGSVFTYLIGIILISEHLELIPVLGIVVTALGAYVLNADQQQTHVLRPFMLLFSERISLIYLVAMGLSSLSAVFDKIALKGLASSNLALTLLTENFVMTMILTFYLHWSQKTWRKEVQTHFRGLFLNAVLYMFVSFSVFAGFLNGPVALVHGVKRLEILFVLILSVVFFHDKPTKHIWLGTAIMLTGVILTKL